MAARIRSPRYLAILALASALILIVGAALRPGGSDDRTVTPPAGETSLTQLQRFTQRRTLDNQAEYLTRVATQVEPAVFRLESSNRSAVRWDRSTLIAAAPHGRMPDSDRAAAGDLQLPVETLLAGPHLPAVVLSITEDALPPPPDHFAAPLYGVGGWALAVWRTVGSQLAWRGGQYLGYRRTSCSGIPVAALTLSLELDDSMAGGGVFDLDGGLMGIILPCDGDLVAVGVSALEDLAARAGDVITRLEHRFGLGVEEPDSAERTALGIEYGFLVSEVWLGYQGYASGIRPGDVIVALDGNPTTALIDLEPLVLPVARETFDLEVQRFGRRRRLSLRARPSAGPRLSPAGLSLLDAASGARIGEVAPDGPAGRAGVRAGDLLVSLNGKPPAGPEELDRMFGDEPVWAVFMREERLWGALLTRSN